MQILFIFSLVFAILVSIFAVMNSDPVTIKLFWKQYEFSQAIVILGSAAFGAIIVALMGVVNKVKSTLKVRELQNKIKGLEKEIEDLRPVSAEELNSEIVENEDIVQKDAFDNIEANVPQEDTETDTNNIDEGI